MAGARMEIIRQELDSIELINETEAKQLKEATAPQSKIIPPPPPDKEDERDIPLGIVVNEAIEVDELEEKKD